MKRFLAFFAIISLISNIFAQNNHNSQQGLQEIADLRSKGRILMMKEECQVPAEQFFGRFSKNFSFTSGTEMVLMGKEVQKNGNTTYRYQQQYMGIPIYSTMMLLHEKNGVVTYANGLWISDFSRPYTPLFPADEAVNVAIKNTPADVYAWQNAALEADLKEAQNDKEATYYPTPHLVFYNTGGSDSHNVSAYRLAYEVDILAIQPLGQHTIFVDAATGEILKQIKKNRNANVKVQAKTRYNGVRTITVDSIAPNQYILRETARGEGNGIYTRNLHNTGSLMQLDSTAALDVVETDNFFATDSVANEAHFGAEKTYDYYYYNFGRNSIDNNGTRLTSYVHLGTNVENACWSNGAMWYGDGTGGRPFTFLSVCGHEITHGLTENTADLVYENEPGALNEAFSDMFGAMIAYYASDTLKWTIGDELGEPFRNMANPKQFQDPNTYQGQYWLFPGTPNADLDNGGVHTNSGVANYWFYLLCMGGSGTNDHHTAYDIAGIGTEKASAIAYYTLTENLTSTSDYEDTRELSLIVAEELYGPCSDEVYAVAAAWNAVGLGYRYSDTAVYVEQILSPATDCALGSEEPITLEFSYNSCSEPLPANTDLEITVVFDGDTLSETVTLASEIESGETFEITLNQTVDASATGSHTLKAFVRPAFAETFTDSITNYQFTNLIYQNTDIHILGITAPESSCHLTESTPISFRVAFDICDSIPAGTEIPIGFRINSGDTIVENFVMPQTVTQADTLTLTFQTGADFTLAPRNNIKVIALNPGDLDNSDNVATKLVTRPISLTEIEEIDFNNNAYTHYSYIEKEEYATTSVLTPSGYSGGKVFNMTGGNILEYYNDLEIPLPIAPWMTNDKLNSRITFCADASDMAEMAIQFDLKQTSGKSTYEMILSSLGGSDLFQGFNLLQSSMMRVLVDGHQVSGNYFPNTPNSDPFTTRAINLSSYVGGLHEITFESKCFSNDVNYGMTFTLDHVYLDNIKLLESNKIDESIAPNARFFAFPNPTTDKLNIQLENIDGQVGYQIFDIYGRRLSEGNLDNTLTTINLGGYATGVYIVRLVQGSRILGNAKIIKE